MTNTLVVAWGGLLIGILFGLFGQRTAFCMTSGLRRAMVDGDGRMLRAFVLAVAIAILGSQLLAGFGWVNLGASIYVTPQVPWLAFVLGGLLFGYGMIMANGCGARALVLLGSGNLRSLVVLLMIGIGGQMALTGLLATTRLALADIASVTLSTATLTGLFGAANSAWAGVIVAVPLAAYVFLSPAFRRSPRHIVGGLAIGALIPVGWFFTGYLGADDFDPVPLASLTFVAPLGGTIQYLMLSTGMALGFAVTTVVGVLLGSFAAAALTRDFELQGFSSPKRMLRYIGGGLLMGIGGAMALGCTIGQGLSGLSTLSVGSLLAVSSIVLGATLGLRGPLKLPSL